MSANSFRGFPGPLKVLTHKDTLERDKKKFSPTLVTFLTDASNPKKSCLI